MTTYEIITQAVGFVGLFFGIIAFQCKKHKGILTLKALNELFASIQYFMLGAYTGMALDLISIGRNITFVELVKRKKSTLIFQILFSIVFVVAGIFTWAGALSLIIIIAKIISCISYGLHNEKFVRLLNLPAMVLWVIYNTSVHSVASVINDTLTIVSIIIGIIRYDIIAPKREKRQSLSTTPETTDQPLQNNN